MKYLGIDYGKKNVGLAISDSSGKVAMPFGIFVNDKNFLEKFVNLLKREKIEALVFGLSLNLDGEENEINREIKKFVKSLKTKNTNFIALDLQIFFQDERFSSMESKWGIEKEIRRSEKKNRKKDFHKKIDDKAATIILQSFLNSRK